MKWPTTTWTLSQSCVVPLVFSTFTLVFILVRQSSTLCLSCCISLFFFFLECIWGCWKVGRTVWKSQKEVILWFIFFGSASLYISKRKTNVDEIKTICTFRKPCVVSWLCCRWVCLNTGGSNAGRSLHCALYSKRPCGGLSGGEAPEADGFGREPTAEDAAHLSAAGWEPLVTRVEELKFHLLMR